MTEKTLATLKEMTEESLHNRPEQAIEATDEYIQNLAEESPEKATKLKRSLEDQDFARNFSEAITHTSLMVFLMSILATSHTSNTPVDINFDEYLNEFLTYAHTDDSQTYSMRLFYLNGLTGRELGFGQINTSDFTTKEELELAQKVATKQLQKYDELLGSLKKKYVEKIGSKF